MLTQKGPELLLGLLEATSDCRDARLHATAATKGSFRGKLARPRAGSALTQNDEYDRSKEEYGIGFLCGFARGAGLQRLVLYFDGSIAF